MSSCRFFLFVFVLGLSCLAFTQTFNDPGFVAETAVAAGGSPMGVTWASDGRMFVWRKAGVVVVFSKDLATSKTFLDIQSRVNKTTDRGLVGFALDPNFETNGFFYLAYVYEPNGNPNDTGPKTQRVSQFKVSAADPTVGDPNSETVILGKISTAGCSGINQDCMPNDAAEHTIDDLAFYGGKLFVSVGDGASDAVSDSAFRSQNLDSLNGKLLRINTDGTGPADNPFFNGDANANRSKVYDYGLRNPFRFSIDSATGNVYIGDVGQNSWEEIDSGRGKNFGWPCYEGNGVESQYDGFATCQNLASSAVTPPIKTYPHTEGACVIGGPLYSGSAYPATYKNNVFYADFVGNFIKRLTLDASGNVTGTTTFVTGLSQPVYVAQGPDGNLYYIEIGAQRVRRIRYVGSGNRPPVAMASANPTFGLAPLSVSFSSAGSTDPDADPLTYSWDLGDGTTSGSANPTHQYAANGKYNAVLTVEDPTGASSTASVVITVGSTPPTATISSPVDGLKANVGQVVNFSGSATDPEDGTLSDASLQWLVILHHNTHTHDVLQATGCCGSFTVEPHDTTATFYYEAKLTAVDSSGLTNSKSVFVYPNITQSADFSVALSSTSATVKAGQTATLTATVASSGTFSDQVTFSCTGLPAGASCTWNPAAVTPAQNSPGTTTLTITTTAPSTAILRPLWRHGTTVGLMVPFLALIFAGFSGRNNRKKIVLLAVISAALLLIQACGGDVKSGASGTPAGTYTVTISAASSGTSALTHSQAVTLTVQ
jgi:glucose/arabinose dehydrogenase